MFPQYNANRKTGERGLTFIKEIVESELNWIFRKVAQDDDFGLDAYLDILNDGKYVTGKQIGIQIKTGVSYFRTKNSNGWVFIGETKHLNYYLNLPFPVIIVLVNIEEKKAYWVEFDINIVTQTEKGWKIIVPSNQVFGLETVESLRQIAGEVIDYLPQLEYQWELNQQLNDSEFFYLAIERQEIESLNTEGFEVLLKRITASEELIQRCKGKLLFVIFGYDQDKRELFEIEEVRLWVTKVLYVFRYWAYFLFMSFDLDDYISKMFGINVIASCVVKTKKIAYDERGISTVVESDLEERIDLAEKLLGWLNEFADKYNVDEEVVFDRSMLIFKNLTMMDDGHIEKIKNEYRNK